MAYEDPARAKKRTRMEIRALTQAGCRVAPCVKVRAILAGDKTLLPVCVVCVHEGRIKKG